MTGITLEKLWEEWRQLAIRELELERQYKPLVTEHELVHRRRSATENLIATYGQPQEINQQIAQEWERLRKGEQLPPIERRPTDIAYDVLARNGSPMHYRVILAELSKAGIVIGGRDPGTTLLAYLGRDKRFAKAREVGRGYWKLKEWEKMK